MLYAATAIFFGMKRGGAVPSQTAPPIRVITLGLTRTDTTFKNLVSRYQPTCSSEEDLLLDLIVATTPIGEI